MTFTLIVIGVGVAVVSFNLWIKRVARSVAKEVVEEELTELGLLDEPEA